MAPALVYVVCGAACDASRAVLCWRGGGRRVDASRANTLARRWLVEPSTRDANLCCSGRRRAPPGAIDAYVTTLRNALARGGRAFRRAVLRGLVRLLAIAAHRAHRWSSSARKLISSPSERLAKRRVTQCKPRRVIQRARNEAPPSWTTAEMNSAFEPPSRPDVAGGLLEARLGQNGGAGAPRTARAVGARDNS